MDTNMLINFVENFNKSKRTASDFIKVAKSLNIDLESLEGPTENGSIFIWKITKIGELRQCKDCSSVEFVKIGEQAKNNCLLIN